MYSSVLIIKGGCEFLLYNISENLYYYLKLPAPILMKLMSIPLNTYGFELIYLMDMGDYLILFNFALPYSIGGSFTWNLHKRYLEKSNFPKEKLLGYFAPMQAKFLSKEENAFMLQFEKNIVWYSQQTYGLIERSDSDYLFGEIIGLNDGLWFWKKGGKSVSFKQTPFNFVDR